MSQGLKLILVIVAGLALIGGIIYFIIPRPARMPVPSAPNAPTATAPQTPQTVTVPPQTPSLAAPTLDDKAKITEKLRQLAFAFAERFGSFSNQGNFQNITDLYPVMTEGFKAHEQQYVAGQMANKNSSASYAGVTTKALSIEITSLDITSSATVVVKTQREGEPSASTSSPAKYQDLTISFKLENGQWLVDSATWK